MHLEDLTSLPLKKIPQRLFEMARNYLTDLGEQVAAQPAGQYIIHKVEDALWAVEKSIEWSAPGEPKTTTKPSQANEAELNGSQKKEPIPEGAPSRPLPWIFFIPVLVIWRGTRLAYEAASSLLGKPPVQSEDVVEFLRNRRRGLRALRIRGKRTTKTVVAYPAVVSKMTSFVNPFFVVLGKMLTLLGFTAKKETKRDLEVSTRSLFAEDEEDGDDAKENVLEKLNRLSMDQDNIEDDPDFEPDSSRSSDVTSSSCADASEEEDVSTPVVTDADVEVEVDAPRPPRTSSFIAEIIEEEDEETEVTDLDAREGTTPADDADVAEDFRSLSARSSSEIFADAGDGQNSAMQKMSGVFKKGLVSQNSF